MRPGDVHSSPSVKLGDDMNDQDQRIPITLLTGFLGAGKTTLVNRILSNPNKERVAVIVNEFGEIGIDGDLISRASDDMLELSNGCICCSGKDDLIESLYKLYMRKSGLVEPKIDFDRIVIETTGLANPAPLAQAFYTDMSLSLTYRLDAIVTLADAKHICLQLKDCPEAERQIALADKIVMNKRDLASDEDFDEALAAVARLNPFAPKEFTSFSEIDVDALLRGSFFDPSAKNSDLNGWLGNENEAAHDHEGPCDAGCSAHHPHHHTDVSSISLRDSREVDYQELMNCLLGLTTEYGPNLYRIKGLVSFSGVGRPVVLQGVQNVFSPLSYVDEWPGGVAETRLVIIGKQLDHQKIRERFEACIAKAKPMLDRALGMI